MRRLGKSTAQRFLVVQVAPSSSPTPRIGILVGKRVGNAVIRNRTKRRIRAAFAPVVGELPAGIDLVVVARSGAAGATFAELAAEIAGGLRRFGLLARAMRATASPLGI